MTVKLQKYGKKSPHNPQRKNRSQSLFKTEGQKQKSSDSI